MRTVSLFSGGLDSILSVKLVQLQDIEVCGLCIITPFNQSDERKATESASHLKIPLKIVRTEDDYIETIVSPKHGYGKNMNPCIDCKIFMYRLAKQYCAEIGTEFFITGEVLGERPMSQNKNTLLFMEKYSGCEDIILRPLSAKLLPTTLMEKSGIIDRTRLCDISGRSRKPHIELAHLFGIDLIPTPAGGCLLTDPNFSRRLKESIEYGEKSSRIFNLLSLGRHFRLPSGKKFIVSRNEKETEKIKNLATPKDTILSSGDVLGLLLNGDNCPEAGMIMARYSKKDEVHYKKNEKEGILKSKPINEVLLSKYRA